LIALYTYCRSGKAVYNILLDQEDINQLLAESDDTHLKSMKMDNPTQCKALVAAMRIEHFPPGIAIGLVRKSRNLQTRSQLESVPIIINRCN
jgi:hypothetical protein